jgi:hypothetical protein
LMQHFLSRLSLSVVLLLASWPSFSAHAAEALWAKYDGDHFIVFLKVPDDAFAKRAHDEAEAALSHILQNLSYTKPKKGWQKSGRAKIYLYESQAAFQTAGGSPSWAAGHANYETKSIASFVTSQSFFDTTLPHEVAHLVLFELTVNFWNVPRWMHEGFALSQEKKMGSRMDPAVKQAAREGKMVPLTMLTIVNPAEQTPGAANVYYAEAKAFVSFLLKKHGGHRFQTLIKKLSEGKEFEDSIERAYKGIYDDMDDLEEKFYAFLNAL